MFSNVKHESDEGRQSREGPLYGDLPRKLFKLFQQKTSIGKVGEKQKKKKVLWYRLRGPWMLVHQEDASMRAMTWHKQEGDFYLIERAPVWAKNHCWVLLGELNLVRNEAQNGFDLKGLKVQVASLEGGGLERQQRRYNVINSRTHNVTGFMLLTLWMTRDRLVVCACARGGDFYF